MMGACFLGEHWKEGEECANFFSFYLFFFLLSSLSITHEITQKSLTWPFNDDPRRLNCPLPSWTFSDISNLWKRSLPDQLQPQWIRVSLKKQNKCNVTFYLKRKSYNRRVVYCMHEKDELMVTVIIRAWWKDRWHYCSVTLMKMWTSCLPVDLDYSVGSLGITCLKGKKNAHKTTS